jgi:hypothetical protein
MFDPTKSEDAINKSFETLLSNGEKQMEKYYPQLLEEVDEVQGIVLAVSWERGSQDRLESRQRASIVSLTSSRRQEAFLNVYFCLK